ncbi:uncharacterized protein LOC128629098 [Ictalurus punctatus]|uniref:Uncharacterized protein LOC128629098 n=1 Tax=Ictalurus punctatus TaxID=7998 RepID=A0A9F7TDR3_ICTPU|nr:uncharacterized protein LOC128629098 [Ictalurus punctatus]
MAVMPGYSVRGKRRPRRLPQLRSPPSLGAPGGGEVEGSEREARGRDREGGLRVRLAWAFPEDGSAFASRSFRVLNFFPSAVFTSGESTGSKHFVAAVVPGDAVREKRPRRRLRRLSLGALPEDPTRLFLSLSPAPKCGFPLRGARTEHFRPRSSRAPERRDQRGGGSAVFLSTLVDTNTSHAWGRLLPGFGRYGHGGRYPAPRVVPANPNVDGSSRTRSRDGESESPPPLGESRIRPVPYVPTQSALRFGVRPARGPPATAARGDGGAARAGPPAEDHSFPRSASPTERERKKSASAAGPRPPAPAPGEGRRAARRDPHPPGAPGATWLILPVTYACLKD